MQNLQQAVPLITRDPKSIHGSRIILKQVGFLETQIYYLRDFLSYLATCLKYHVPVFPIFIH